MKTLKTAAIALAAIICMSACGNAGAREKKKAADAPKAVVELTAETFNSKVFDTTKETAVFLGDKPAIVDFTATWCGPCQRLAPILEELANEYKGKVDIYKVNVDDEQELASLFRIRSVPTLVFAPMEGDPHIASGAPSKAQLRKALDSFIGN